MKQEELDEATMYELMEEHSSNQRYHSNEGARGIANLEELICDLDGQYKYNGIGVSTLHNFLEDNSGAIEAIRNWIEEQNIEEWKENLRNTIPLDEEELEEDK